MLQKHNTTDWPHEAALTFVNGKQLAQITGVNKGGIKTVAITQKKKYKYMLVTRHTNRVYNHSVCNQLVVVKLVSMFSSISHCHKKKKSHFTTKHTTHFLAFNDCLGVCPVLLDFSLFHQS